MLEEIYLHKINSVSTIQNFLLLASCFQPSQQY